MTIFLSYLFYFIVASASPLQRRWLAKTKNADNKGQIHFAFQTAFIVAILGSFFPLFSPIKLSEGHHSIILFTVVTGMLGAIFYVCSYTAQKHVEAGVASIISNINTPVTILFSSIFLHESLASHQILGTILLLVSIVIISKKHHIGNFHFDRYFLLMLLSGVTLAFVLVVDRALINQAGLSLGTMLSFWSTAIWLWVASVVTRNHSDYSITDILITGVLRFLQNISWFVLVYVVGNLSVVSAISTFKVVIIFIAAAVFLNEREDLPRKIFGSILAVLGLLLMK
jgi:drug/metabolite transporter (DMT)-like permease